MRIYNTPVATEMREIEVFASYKMLCGISKNQHYAIFVRIEKTVRTKVRTVFSL